MSTIKVTYPNTNMSELCDMISNLSLNDNKPKKKESLPRYVSVEFSGETSLKLKQPILEFASSTGVDLTRYEIQRGVSDHAHLTMVFSSDLELDAYREVIKSYEPFKDQSIEVEVTGLAMDSTCVALVARPIQLKSYPEKRHSHVTMMLHNQAPVYSNQLLSKVLAKLQEPAVAGHSYSYPPVDASEDIETYHYHHLKEPVRVSGLVKFIGHLKIKAPHA
jgi:hypothetical protein